MLLCLLCNSSADHLQELLRLLQLGSTWCGTRRPHPTVNGLESIPQVNPLAAAAAGHLVPAAVDV